MTVGPEPEFVIQSVISPDRHTLVLRGELDSGAASQLELLVSRVCAEAPPEILLDIAQLSFLDSSGLGAILRAQRVCDEHGVPFKLTPGRQRVQRVFEVTGMIDVLPFTPGGELPLA